MSVADEFPLVEEDNEESTKPQPDSTPIEEHIEESKLRLIWAQLTDFGLAEPALRLGTHTLAIVLVVAVILAMRNFYLNAQLSRLEIPQQAALAASLQDEDEEPTPAPTPTAVSLPEFSPNTAFLDGIPRFALLHTTIPSRPRVDIIPYIVKQGDTVFGIAEKFGLRPQTIFWGNRETLGDNPHNLRVGQELNILPVNGTYHMWREGESFARVAEYYGVDPLTIVEYPGNSMQPETFDIQNPNIEPGKYLIVPGGTREFVDWGPPRIPRDNPAVARTYGPGHCGTISDGAVGAGLFVWPTTAGYLSGYDYSPASNHNGIDIAGSIGNPVYAADAGVVVYSGWSNFGYGYLVVLDHGNGWQSLYAHLSAINVICGQSVFQGTGIGGVGSTGNSSGAHLHFELMYGTAKVNPWNYVSP